MSVYIVSSLGALDVDTYDVCVCLYVCMYVCMYVCLHCL